MEAQKTILSLVIDNVISSIVLRSLVYCVAVWAPLLALVWCKNAGCAVAVSVAGAATPADQPKFHSMT
jgi:hypothetical protein